MSEDLSPLNQGNEIIVKDCEDAIVKVKSNGKFQKVTIFLLILCYTCTGALIMSAMVFLEKDPPITCYRITEGKEEAYECTRKEACKEGMKHVFHFIENETYSWTNDLKLDCTKNFQIGLIGSLFFIGSMISSLIAPTMADYFGRAGIIKYSMYLHGVVVLIAPVFSNITAILISMFLLGLLNSMHSTIPYILISEYVSKEHMSKYLTVMFMFESFSEIISTIFFFFFQNWKIFLYFNFIYGAIFIIFSFLLVESPRFLYSNKRYAEAREVLKKISKFNTGQEIMIKFEKENCIEEVTSAQTKTNVVTFKSIFINKKYRLYIIIIPLIWFLDAFAFYAINFMIKYLNQNIYLMNSIIFCSDIISYFISNVLMNCFGKRNLMMGSFLLSGICFLAFYVLQIFNFNHIACIIALTFLSKFGASVVLNISSIYTNECFPTHLRGRSTAICSFLGKFGGIIAPMLVEMSTLTGVISGSTCIFAALIIIPIRNHSAQIALNDEQEEQEEKKCEVSEEENKTEEKKEIKIEV